MQPGATPRLTVSRAGQTWLVVPVDVHGGITHEIAFGAGTIWIVANQLTAGAPAGAWVGLRVRGGSVRLAQDALLLPQAGALDVPVADQIGLELDLDPPAPDGPPDGPGSEATTTQVQVPANATFMFGPLGVEQIDTAPASLTVYGASVSLTRQAAAARFEPALRMVLVPMELEPAPLEIGAARSALYVPSGSAPISEAGWGLGVTHGSPDNLGTADGAGWVVLGAGDGLQATWRGLDGEPARLGSTFIAASPDSLMVVSPAATHFRSGMRAELWSETPDQRSTLEVTFPRPFMSWFISQRSGVDTVRLAAHVTAHLDRPMLASGERAPVVIDGTLVLTQDATHSTLGVEAVTQIPPPAPPLAMALSNALLTVHPPHRLFVNGTLGLDLQLDSGTLDLEFGLFQVVPTLADPYAANFAARRDRDAPFGGTTVRARVVWLDPGTPALDVTLNAADDAVPQLLPQPGRFTLDPLLDSVLRGQHSAYYWMLDVSSGADQLGVSLSMPLEPGQLGTLAIKDLAIQAPAARMQSFMLPQFQWEPVRNTRNVLTKDTDGFLTSNEDGGPTILLAQTVNLVPVAPVPVATELVRAYVEDRAPARAKFTLPFGMHARAELSTDERYLTRPGLELVSVPFDDRGLLGARQIKLTAGTQATLVHNPHPIDLPIAQISSLLLGLTEQTVNFPGQTPDNALGVNRGFFNAGFQNEVPITRIDLSGYGASIFSRWILAGDPDVGITQVSFDAFNGRASYERVQLVSYLWPCLARVIRTIIFERQGSGLVRRWDSGWLATTPGLFNLPGKFEAIHPGVVDGMYDIREIRDTDQIFPVLGAEVQAVYYDADVAFVATGPNPPVVAGQNSVGRVPTRRQLGYVQRVPVGAGAPAASLLADIEFQALLDRTGPIGGDVDCVIRIGSSEQQMRVTGLFTSSTRPGAGPLQFALAAYGSPLLPSNSRWSVVRTPVGGGDQTVRTIDAARGVPLIRAKNQAYRWAEPDDLLHDHDPGVDYAFLLSYDAQRMVFPRLKIETGASNLSSEIHPRLADPFRMLQSTGLFPPLNQAIDTRQTVELTPSTLQLASGALSFNLAPPPVQTLVDVPAWTDKLDYTGVGFDVDSLNNWQIRIRGLQQVLGFSTGGEMFRIVHDAVSESGLPSEFGSPSLHLSPGIEAVAEVLDILKRLDPTAMHGGDGPLKLSVNMSGTTFSLDAVADFDIADEDGNAIDCGMGKLKGHLKVGVQLTAELLKHDVHGAVFLEITGSWQQLVFPLIYGGGLLRFAVRADEAGHTTFDLDACTCGSVGGDIIPKLVSLEATVKYGYFIRFSDGAFRPGIVMGLEGRAKLLSGLVGFKLTIEGRLLVTPVNVPRDPLNAAINLYGEILVAGTVTVAWLVDERKSWTTSFDVNVDWKTALLAWKAGLLPVP